MHFFKKSFVLLLTSWLTYSCASDDGQNDHSFLDQQAQGQILGRSWVYQDGQVDDSPFDEDLIGIQLFAEQLSSDCQPYPQSTRSKVFFFLPLEEGIYTLGANESDDGQSATLFDPSENENVLVRDGVIEILSINSKEMVGRLNIRQSHNNFINGSFTIVFCQ